MNIVLDISDVKRSESFQEEGGKRSRPGTGRILPVPPTQSPPRKSDSPRGRVRPIKSPRQEEAGKLEQEDEDKDEMWRRDPRSADPAIDIDYFFQNHTNGRVSSGTARSGHSSQYDTHRSTSPMRSDSPLTGRSSASLATNVLLGDTSDVVQAVRDRRSHRETSHSYSKSNSDGFIPIKDADSDSENGSFFAIVDGHGHWRNSSADSARSGYTRSVSEPHTAKPLPASIARTRQDVSVVTKPLSSKPKEKTYIVSKHSRQSSNIDSEHSESESILSTSTDYSYSETPSP